MHDTAEVDAPFAPLKPNEIGPVAEPASEGELVLPVPADAPPMPETHFDARATVGAVVVLRRYRRADVSRCCGSINLTAVKNSGR